MSGHHKPLLSRQPCRTDPQSCRTDPSPPIDIPLFLLLCMDSLFMTCHKGYLSDQSDVQSTGVQCSPLSYPATGCSTHILNIPLIRRISGREFLSPYNRTLYCSLYMFVANRTHQIAYFDHPMKVDQSDFFYDHVCSILGDTGSQACLVNKRYVSVWFHVPNVPRVQAPQCPLIQREISLLLLFPSLFLYSVV